MTFIEIMIVVSLISIISVALYHGLSNGLRVWEQSKRLIVEEDIALFFEKISQDLRNSLSYSKINFESDFYSFSFPTVVRTLVTTSKQDELVEQIGKVQYAFDPSSKNLVRKQADYGQALSGDYDPPQVLVAHIDSIKFGFIYLTDKEQVYSEKILETIPSAVEVEVKFTENKQKRSFKRVIEVPIGN